MAIKSSNVMARVEPEVKEQAEAILAEQFSARMAEGLAQAQADRSAPAEEVFDRLIGELSRGKAV